MVVSVADESDLVAQVADIFKMMGDQTRLGILLACLDRTVAVGELALQLGLSQSLISHHLRLLRAARIVRFERRGKQVFYTAADDHIRDVVRDMIDHAREEALPHKVAPSRAGKRVA